MSNDLLETESKITRKLFIPRFDKYLYPLDQDYEHFIECDKEKRKTL